MGKVNQSQNVVISIGGNNNLGKVRVGVDLIEECFKFVPGRHVVQMCRPENFGATLPDPVGVLGKLSFDINIICPFAPGANQIPPFLCSAGKCPPFGAASHCDDNTAGIDSKSFESC